MSGSSTCPVCRTSFNAGQKFNARDIEQQIYQRRGYCSGCNRRVTLCYAPINVNLDGEGGGGGGGQAKAQGFELQAIFGIKCPTPGPSLTWSKENKFATLQPRPEAKCVSLKGVTYQLFFNPFASGDFAENRVLKLVEWFSGHCHAFYS